MRSLLKWLSIVLATLVVGLGVFLFGMRFHDGPIEIISGGPFRSGEWVSTPADWNFVSGRKTIEFQTMQPATSRTVWLAVYNGRLFLISGYMTTLYGRIWKQWPHYIERDDRVILRIDGRLYAQRLERIEDSEVVAPVMAKFGRKYGFEGDTGTVSSGYAWLYEVLPRS